MNPRDRFFGLPNRLSPRVRVDTSDFCHRLSPTSAVLLGLPHRPRSRLGCDPKVVEDTQADPVSEVVVVVLVTVPPFHRLGVPSLIPGRDLLSTRDTMSVHLVPGPTDPEQPRPYSRQWIWTKTELGTRIPVHSRRRPSLLLHLNHRYRIPVSTGEGYPGNRKSHGPGSRRDIPTCPTCDVLRTPEVNVSNHLLWRYLTRYDMGTDRLKGFQSTDYPFYDSSLQSLGFRGPTPSSH